MRSRRLLVLAGAIGAAAVLAVVLIVVATGNSSHTATTTDSSGTNGTPARPSVLFAGIPQQGDTVGKPAAPAKMLVFEDPQCPYCQQWTLDTLPTVVDEFVRSGRLTLVYRGIEVIGPNSEKGLRAVFAAGRQNKLWNFSSALYDVQGAENSGWITDDVIRSAAAAAGADGAAILGASSSNEVSAQLALAGREAQIFQVRGTPTFVLEQPPALPTQLAVASLEPGPFTAALSAALQ